MGVEVAGEHDRQGLFAQPLDDAANLCGAVLAVTVDLEVGRDREERRARPLDSRDQPDVATDHALEIELVGLGARQLDHPHGGDRPPRQDRDPEQRLEVLAAPGGRGVVVAAERGLEEERRPDAVEAERRGQVRGHVAVAGTRHPEIDFVEHQEVGARELRMVEQSVRHSLVPVAVLDVPVDDLDRTGPGRGGGRRGRSVAVGGREQPVEAFAQRGPAGRSPQRLDGEEWFHFPLERGAFLDQRGVPGHQPLKPCRRT